MSLISWHSRMVENSETLRTCSQLGELVPGIPSDERS